ncbi:MULTISPECIES: DUF3299 domain-containing protein [Pirellulaceae]|uniref:DUF3299 domain-containing protein n=1 Tax=Blastopirellula marina TaxID=124 RepID=A0A2S8G6N9_9BACT|nr:MULTISPECIES: DUF3299 domain-containing protein [Pirellulaceae]PQO39814.1 hypothetical protein C5Y83_03465 [Blastopirellula marina]
MYLTLKTLSLASVLIALAISSLGCTPNGTPQPTSTTHDPIEAASSPPTDVTEDAETESADSPISDKPKSPANVEDIAEQAASQTDDSENLIAAADPPKPTVTKSTTPKPQPGKTIDMTFDDIKFDIEPDADFEREMIPQPIEDLKKQKIRIGGYILPGFQSRDIKQFVLVRDNMECCFGPGAALYDCILVEMSGRGVDFTVRPVTVEGEFTIQEYKDGDGKVRAIYHMQGTNVR